VGTEIERKYRLTEADAERLRARLREVGAAGGGREFEENTLYAGANLEPGRRNLRLRRVGARGVLTMKERQPSEPNFKTHREEETDVADAEAVAAILSALGYAPALVYEKRRETWHLGAAEVVIDELPFGLFAEIEGDPDAILAAERALGLDALTPEPRTYPDLTREHGSPRGGVIEARFGAGGQADG
jgi:adenylate cyclase class 2